MDVTKGAGVKENRPSYNRFVVVRYLTTNQD